MTYSLDLADIRSANVSRLTCWHGEEDDWTLADWSNAMCGEAGEAANKVKKIRRTESHLHGAQMYTGDGNSAALVTLPAAEARQALTAQLADELADVLLYADLLAHHVGIDLAVAVAAKFNRVSEAPVQAVDGDRADVREAYRRGYVTGQAAARRGEPVDEVRAVERMRGRYRPRAGMSRAVTAAGEGERCE